MKRPPGGQAFEETGSRSKIEKPSAYGAVDLDATVAFPLLAGALVQEGKIIERRRRRREPEVAWGERGG